ncbi:MAG: shikimate dehydrogenase [Myxococcales bacterium]|nr:shikimate dehydrogenase [Myxococcales bacterium]MCB9644287.1 shikimate dehydrogenase [Myxococcales bacterium]
MISAKTQPCVIFGDPVEHSLSPRMHNAAYKALDLEEAYVYLAAQVRADDLAQAIQGARVMGFRGVTCTIPHKTAVIPLLDELDPIARDIGAVNTVVHQDGKMIGYNTDWIGIVEPLRKRRSLHGARVAILGAGGTARAAGYGLREAGAELFFLNRTVGRARLLADEIGGQAHPLDEIGILHDCEIILNTTSVGMSPRDQVSPLPKDAFRKTHLVMDAIYTPLYTKLLQDARDVGAEVICGVEMFLYQGIAQFKLYTGHDAPIEVMQQVLIERLGNW